MSAAATRLAVSRLPMFSPLRHGIFTAIWTARVLSAIGSQIQQVGAARLMTSLAPNADAVLSGVLFNRPINLQPSERTLRPSQSRRNR